MALLVKGEATVYGLAIRAALSFKASILENVLHELVAKLDSPSFIRLGNGGQLISFTIRRLKHRTNITLDYIQAGKPSQNGFAESFVGTNRAGVLNAEVLHSINEADVETTSWLHTYNRERPRS